MDSAHHGRPPLAAVEGTQEVFSRTLDGFTSPETGSKMLPAEILLLDAWRTGGSCDLVGQKLRNLRAYEEWVRSSGVQTVVDKFKSANSETELEGASEQFKTFPRPDRVKHFEVERDRYAEIVTARLGEKSEQSSEEIEKVALLATRMAYADAEPSSAVRMLKADGEFFKNAIAYLSLDEISAELRDRIAIYPSIVQTFLFELKRFITGHPGAPDDFVARLQTEPEGLREPFDIFHNQFLTECEGWRAVDARDETIRIRGEFLSYLCSTQDEATNPDGFKQYPIKLSRAYISGEFSLSNVSLPQALLLRGCKFEQAIDLVDVVARTVHLGNVFTPGVKVHRCTIDGMLFLHDGFNSSDGVEIISSSISGNFECRGASFHQSNSAALYIASSNVKGSAFLADMHCDGKICISDSTIGQQFILYNSILRNTNDHCFETNHCEIGGSLSLNHGFRCVGGFSLADTKILGSIDGGGAVFRGGAKWPSSFSGLDLTVGGDVSFGSRIILGRGFEVCSSHFLGEVNLKNARIGGDFSAIGANFEDRTALCLEDATIGGSIHLGTFFVTTWKTDAPSGSGEDKSVEEHPSRYVGDVRLDRCVVERHVSFRGGRVDGFLSFQDARIKGTVDLGQAASFEGVSLAGAELGGELRCDTSTFKLPDGVALNSNRARIRGQVLLSDGFNADGLVDFGFARIDGSLKCTGGIFSNPERASLRLSGAEVTGMVLLDEGFESHGEVQCNSLRVKGNIITSGGKFCSCGRSEIVEILGRNVNIAMHVLSLDGCRIDGTLALGRDAELLGSLDLSRARADVVLIHGPALPPPTVVSRPPKADSGEKPSTVENNSPLAGAGEADTLLGPQRTLPCNMSLDGFTYEHIEFSGPIPAKTVLKRMLTREQATLSAPEPPTRPYEQAMMAMQRLGREADAQSAGRLKSAMLRKSEWLRARREVD